MYEIPVYKLSLVRDGSQKAITDKEILIALAFILLIYINFVLIACL